uniref:Cytoplasmic protein n=1 Tax=Caenorhabditis tropicalis TaxID=1561998 RepID=A0A1I7UP60_9PELO
MSTDLSDSAPTSPDYTLKEHTADTECINDVYTHIARFFDLPIYSNYVTAENKETHLPVWVIRIFLKFGWIQQFFGDKEKKIRDAMMDTVLFLAPEKRTLMTEKFMKRTLQKEANELN